MSVMWWNFIDWEWRENKPINTDLQGYKACKDRKHGLCPFVFVVVKETGNQGGEWKQWVQFFFFFLLLKWVIVLHCYTQVLFWRICMLVEYLYFLKKETTFSLQFYHDLKMP